MGFHSSKLFVLILFFSTISFSFCGQRSQFLLFKLCMSTKGLSNSLVDQQSNPNRYIQLNYQWNVRIPPVNPLAYFLPNSTKEVQIVVKCASSLNIPVMPKSGSHSYESFSFGTSKTVIIDFRYMEQIKVNEKEQTATIQPGARVGPIYSKLWRSGGFGLPMGNCLTVGIGGHALGGGNGYFDRKFGLVMDHIIEFKMVTAAGKAVTVSSTKHPDLFWALRGIGSGFIGIVTSFKFKTIDVSKIKITFVQLLYDFIYSAEVFQAWQNWIKWVNEDEPTIVTKVLYNGNQVSQFSHYQPGISIWISFFQEGSQQENSAANSNLLKMITQILPPTQNMTITYPNYIKYVVGTASQKMYAAAKLTENDLANFGSEALIQQAYTINKSFFVNKYFNSVTMERVMPVIRRIEKQAVYLYLESVGGALQNISNKETAYVHRNALYGTEFKYTEEKGSPYEEGGKAWIQDFLRESKFMDNGETYQNYVDRDLKYYLNRYYGSNLKRVMDTKRRWDPKNYFVNPQSVPVV